MDRTPSFKLSKDEKREVKQRIADVRVAGGEVFHFPEDRMTVVVKPVFEGSEFVHVAVSHCAEHEPKFRKTLGALHALDRMDYGAPMSVRKAASDTLEDVAYNIVALNG